MAYKNLKVIYIYIKYKKMIYYFNYFLYEIKINSLF